MTLHLLKLAVGIEDIGHLRAVQTARLRDTSRLFHVTRFKPRRADEIVADGSIYWVIRRVIQVRQAITGFERYRVPGGGDHKWAIMLDPDLIPTEPVRRRPHQGWRYFQPQDAPPDIDVAATGGEAAMPPEMAAELRALGLI